MRPPDERNRRTGHPAARRTPDDGIAKAATSLADRADGADPRAIGELLATWLGIKLDEVDELVAEAKVKLSTLPSQQVLWECFGEWLLRLVALEREVGDLRAEVAQLRRKGRAA
jgi:hypothetical protein